MVFHEESAVIENGTSEKLAETKLVFFKGRVHFYQATLEDIEGVCISPWFLQDISCLKLLPLQPIAYIMDGILSDLVEVVNFFQVLLQEQLGLI